MISPVEAYRAPRWLHGGHAQTIYPAVFLRGRRPRYRRERWDAPDGDFIDVDFLDSSRAGAPRVALFHGLEGSSSSHYAVALMHALARAQWNGVALPVRRPRPIEGPSSFRGRRIGAPEELLQIDDGVPVYLADALTALRHFDRELARSWWRDWFDRNPHRHSLVFRIHEGTLIPVGFAVVRYPELADFDSW